MKKNLIRNFLNNRSSGAASLVEQEISIIRKLLNEEAEIEEIRDLINEAANKFAEMAPIQKIKYYFRNNDLNLQNLNKLSENFNKDEFIKNSNFLFEKPKNILTLSNSSSVRKVLINYKKYVCKVYCCHSLPLAEGEVFFNILKSERINAKLIEDFEIGKFRKDIDLILVGADAVGEKYFINKSGTELIALFANYYKIPMYVVSSSIKFFSLNEFSQIEIGKYFEKVSLELVNKIIF